MKKLFLIFSFLSLILAVFFTVFSLSVLGDEGMSPTLKNGQIILLRRNPLVSFQLNFNRGDIVSYQPTEAGSHLRVGRVVGLPLESVRVSQGKIYLDDGRGKYQLEEDYLPSETVTRAVEEDTWIKMGSDEFLILGDNRDISLFPLRQRIISREEIKGKFLIKF